jgi:hypothetical protein
VQRVLRRKLAASFAEECRNKQKNHPLAGNAVLTLAFSIST